MGEKAWQHVKYWSDFCRRNHSKCSQPSPNFTPTRLVDVGNTDSDHVRLVCNVMRGEYAALSHCWGSSQHLTTKANLESLQLPIALEQASKKLFRCRSRNATARRPIPLDRFALYRSRRPCRLGYRSIDYGICVQQC